MKKLIMVVAAAIIGLFTLIGPASAATDDKPDADNKKVTLCHATSSEKNPYEKITVSVSAFINAGHILHEDDIWEAFTYVTKGGQTVSVPAQGDTSLLAFEDCEAPKQNEKIAKPQAVVVDKCETKDDVLSVAPGRGYTVGNVSVVGLVQTVVVTLNEGFEWADGSTAPLTFTHTFTDVDCDLPDTGVGPQQFTIAGGSALAALALAGVMFMTSRRKVNA